MIKLLSIFGMAFLVGFSGAVAPGPVFTMTISESLKRGFRAGPLIVFGHAILEILLLLAIMLGLNEWLVKPEVTKFFALVGGIILLVMGGQMIVTEKKATEQALHAEAKPEDAMRGPVMAGIVLSLSNPYWIIWWATIGLGLITKSLEAGLIGLALFYCGHILADLTWYSFVSYTVSAGRRLCPPLVYRIIFVVCGAGLIGLGLWFLISLL
ncbi:MAG: LysE family transporter [Kiritimatiellia bacterium]